jgi:enoyl-CoA hydratase
MRNDRASAWEQGGMPAEAAMENEFRRGLTTLASGESLAGSARFARGAGRHGAF